MTNGQQEIRREPSGGLSRILLAAVCVAMITAAVHWPALSSRALSFDDFDYLIRNSLVPNPSWAAARQVVSEVYKSSVVPGYYHPLGILSLMLDCSWGASPENPRVFHITSLTLHAVNTGLCVLLLWRLFRRVWPAVLVGLLFGVHPLTIEPVAWIGERKTLLSMFFSLVGLLSYLAYVRRCGEAGSRPASAETPIVRGTITRRLFYVASLIAFSLSVLSKPTSTPFPALLLILDWWPQRRLSVRAVLEKVPYFLVAGVSVLITLKSHAETGSISSPAEQGSFVTFFVLCHNIGLYLRQLAWPGELSFFYDWPQPLAISNRAVSVGVVSTVVLAIGVIVSLRWTRAVLAGTAFFLIAILPAMGIIRVNLAIAGDRFVYLPAIGILAILAAAVARLGHVDGKPSLKVWRVVGFLGLLAAIATGIWMTRLNYQPWKDTESLYRRMVAHNPQSARVHYNLALELQQTGKADDAIVHYQEALRLLPAGNSGAGDASTKPLAEEAAKARNNLAALLAKRGRPEDALEQFAAAVAQDSNNYRARSNYGAALAKARRYDEAIIQLEIAIRLAPSFVPAHVNRGRALFNQGKVEAATKSMQDAARLEPRSLGAFIQLGDELSSGGQRELAVTVFREVLKIVPGQPEVQARLRALNASP